jgi:hypothetical protein
MPSEILDGCRPYGNQWSGFTQGSMVKNYSLGWLYQARFWLSVQDTSAGGNHFYDKSKVFAT